MLDNVRRLGRRRFLGATGALAGVTVLAACTPAAAPTKPVEPTKPAETVKPTAAATKPATEATKPADAAKPAGSTSAASGRVIVVMGQQPDTLMPRIGSMMARTEVLGAIQTRAVHSNENGEWVAMGVTQVPSFDNGGANWVGEGDDRHLEVTFKIRPGLKWHDGTPVTAKDTVFAWQLIMNPTFKVDDRSQEQKVNSVDAPDDQTAVFKYHSAKQARDAAANGFKGIPADDFKAWAQQKEPIGDPLYMIILGDAFFLPQHILGNVEPGAIESHEFSRKPILAGPYKFVEWVPDQSITLEAVADHPLGAPKIQTVVFRIIKDTNAQLAALQAGEIDVMTQVQGVDVDKAPELDRMAATGQFKVHYVPGSPWEHLDLNLDNEHLKDKNVRKALIQGMNREQIVERVLNGKTRVAHSWVQPGVPAWAWDESCLTKYSYNPDAAKQLLTQAGYTAGPDGTMTKDGRPLQFKLQTTDAALRQNTAQVIQAQLKQIGVNIELEFIPGRGLFENQGPLKTRTFDIGMYTWLSQADPNREDYLHSKNIPTEANNLAGNNYMGYRNARVDELALRGASLIDEAERQPIYCELQQIVTDELPFIPLFQRVVVAVQRTSIQNFKPTPSSTPETWNIYEWSVA